MFTDTYKAQAERLASHLATKHGIKLKPSSLLEAVAALHGARDWNTLAAATTGAPAQTPLSIESLLLGAVRSGATPLEPLPQGLGLGTLRWQLQYSGPGVHMELKLNDDLAAHVRKLKVTGADAAPVNSPALNPTAYAQALLIEALDSGASQLTLEAPGPGQSDWEMHYCSATAVVKRPMPPKRADEVMFLFRQLAKMPMGAPAPEQCGTFRLKALDGKTEHLGEVSISERDDRVVRLCVQLQIG